MKRRTWILVLVIVVVAGGAFFGWHYIRTRSKATTGNEVSYTPVRVTRGRLTVNVDASGYVSMANEVDVTPGSDGKISAVLVEPGQTVKKGQVLVRLNPADAQTSLQQAEDALNIAKTRLQMAKQTAELSPLQAQQAVDRAKASLASAQSAYDKLMAGPDQSELDQANIQVSQAQLSLQSAQANYDRMKRLYDAQAVTKQQLDDADNQLQNAKQSLASAQSKLDQLKAPPKDEDVAAAKANITQSQTDLDIAQQNLSTVGQDDQVASAESDLRRAQDAYDQAKKDLENMTVTAPAAGLVTQVNAKVGSSVGSTVSTQSVLVTLAEQGQLVVEVEVNQNDIAQVQPGQNVTITVDALPDAQFSGRVVSVGNIGNSQGGVVTYTVKAAILDQDPRIKIGMTADASIVVVDRPDALSVPNTALTTRMGQPAVRIYQPDGSVSYRSVTTGLRTETSTEIIDGLSDNDQVAVPQGATVIGAPSTGNNQNRSNGGNGQFFMGPGMGGAVIRRGE